MNNLDYQIKEIIETNFNNFNVDSEELKEVITLQVLHQVKIHNKKNLQILLDFCKLVEKEEKGLLFIRNMIRNIINE